MALIYSADPARRAGIVDSFYPEFWPPLRIPAAETRRFGFDLTVPIGWDAVVSPLSAKGEDRLVALDCTTGANLRVSLYEVAPLTPLADFTDPNVDGLTDLEGFQAIDFYSTTTDAGTPVEVIDFTWVDQGSPVRQMQIYAVSGTTGFILTYTWGNDPGTDYLGLGDEVLYSYEVSGFPGDR
jgi:hypothetical protein